MNQRLSIFVVAAMSVMLACYFIELVSAEDARTCNDLCFKAKDGICDVSVEATQNL